MSRFDEERKRLGIPISSGSSSVSNFLAEERKRLSNGQKTRYSEVKEQEVMNTAASKKEGKLNQAKKKKVETKNKTSFGGAADKVKNFFSGKDVDGDGERDGLLGAIDRFVLPISKGATEVLAPGNHEAMKQMEIRKYGKVTNPVTKAADKNRGTETKVLNTIGAMGAYLAPYGQAYKAADLVVNKVPKLANLANPFVQKAIRGGIAGGLAEGGLSAENELFNSEAYNKKDYAIRTGIGIAGGAILDPALYGVGRGISKGIDKGLRKLLPEDLPKFNGKVAKETVDQLAPKQNVVKPPNGNPIEPTVTNTSRPFNVNRYNNPTQPLKEFLGKQQKETPLLQMAKKTMYEERKLPDFSASRHVTEKPDNVNVYGVETPRDLVESPPPGYWKQRYEEFAQQVNEEYDTDFLSKEAFDDLWSQFARYDEPVTLDQAVELAYKGYKETKPIDATEVWNQFGNRPPVSQNAKNIMGIGENGIPQAKQPKSIQQVIQNLSALKTPKEPVNPAETNLNTNTPELPFRPKETVPVQPKQQGERSFFDTVANSDKITPEMAQRLAEFDKSYTPMSNEELVNYANDFVTKDSEKAFQFVKNARKFDPRHVTVGHRLIDELQKTGQYDRALDVVERLAEQGTKAGQSIQSYSIYNRLSVEGQLLRAQRRVNQINEGITNPAKQVKLTPETMDNIAHTADSIKRFTGQEEQANNVMNIMENIKKGNHPTDAELETVRSFVNDAKQFVGDLNPGAEPAKPKKLNDIRTRDKVVDFMSKREEVARERLKARMNRANSLPVDVFYDLSVIGASKIAKGTVKVADFSEEMVQEFGETVRPYVNQIYNKAVETFNLQSETMTRKRLSEVEKITNKALKDKNLDPESADSIREFARQVAAMTGDAKIESSMELQTVLQALERPTFGQKLSSAQTIAQLLNPKTVVRNAIGNEMFYRVEQINKLVATPIDMVKSKITGADRVVTFRSFNQGQYWKNWMTGAKAGWKGVNPMGLTTAYDLGPQAFRSKYNPLTYMEKALGATLRSFDYAGYMRAYNSTLGELANLRAINEGLTGQAKKEAIQQYIRSADENMMHIADAYGKYATFQDTTALSNALTKVKKGMNKVSTLGATEDFGLGDLVLKYPKTPGNLIMRALEYSPAGFVRSASILKDLKKVKSSQNEREFYLTLTRAIVGTGGFSLLGYVLADKGILTSSGSSDFEVASLEKSAGKQPNSVNVSALNRFFNSGFNLEDTGTQDGDTFVSYDWAQPISMAMALGTGVSQSAKENGELSVGGAIKGSADSASNTIIQQSVLKGLNSFLANYPGRTMSDRVGDAGKGIAGSFVPTLLNQFRQTNDNTTRSTYDPSILKEVLNRATNRIPGSEKSLPKAYDTLGNEKQNFQKGSNNAFNVFLNPSFVSQYKPSPEAKFVLDYINKTGDKTVAPRLAQKKLDGEPLTGAQYSEMQRIMGEEVQRGLESVVPRMQGESNPERIKKAIDKILTSAGRKGREKIRSERGE